MHDYDELIRRAYQFVQDQRLGEALKTFREASQLNPSEPEPLVQLALIFEHFGDLEGAAGLFEKAASLDASSAFAVLKLGLLRYFAGDMERAVTYLDRGVRLIETGSSVVRKELADGAHDEFEPENGRRVLTQLRELEETAALARDLLSEIGASSVGTPPLRQVAHGDPPRYRIGILTALWQRPALSQIVLSRYQSIRSNLPSIDVRLYAVGSEGSASRHIAEENGFAYVEHANEPLGAKWNAGLQAMRNDNVDAVVIVGSDDLLDETYFLRQADLLNEGCRLSGLQDMYVFDLRTLRFAYWPGYDERSGRKGEPIGLGRCVHRSLLDALEWKLWDDRQNNMLDHSMYVRLLPHLQDGSLTALLSCRQENMLALDVKHDSNMWSMDQIVSSMNHVEFGEPVKFLQSFLSPTEIRALLSLSDEAERIGSVMNDVEAATWDAGLGRLAGVS